MINKLNSDLAFTSKVNIIYNADKHFKDLYTSKAAAEAVKELENNGIDDVVTIIPEFVHDMCSRIPAFLLRVVDKHNGYSSIKEASSLGAHPSQIVNTYKQAKYNNSFAYRLDDNTPVLDNII